MVAKIPAAGVSLDGAVVVNESSSDVNFRIEGNGDANTFFLDGEVDRVYLGNNVNTQVASLDARLQVVGTDYDSSGISATRYSNDGSGATIVLAKSRNASIGGNTIVTANDEYGKIRFAGNDGGDFLNVTAMINAFCDATPGTDDMPGALAFHTAADGTSGTTERIRIHNNGRVQFNMETMGNGASTTNAGLEIFSGINPLIQHAHSGAGLSTHVNFINDNGVVGTIKTTGTATQFNTSSDYRLKENVVTDWDATTRLKQLKPSRFNFIADADKTVDGFLAHEVSSIVPEAIAGTKDETETKTNVVLDANGSIMNEGVSEATWNASKTKSDRDDESGIAQYPSDSTWVASKVVPVHQSIDQSKLVPLLVKTIQELEARITTLEG